MADNVVLNSMAGGDTAAADDIGGIKHQRVKVEYGADGSATDVDATHGLPTVGGYTEVTGSASANNTDVIASTDVEAYRWVSVHLTAFGVGTVTFQGCNDNSSWVAVPLTLATSTSPSPTTTATATGIYAGPVNFRYFRVRITAYTSGTMTATADFLAAPSSITSVALSASGGAAPVAQSGTWTVQPGNTANSTAWLVDTELPAAAALADGASNPTAPMAGAAGLVWNGSTWDRVKSFGAAGAVGVTPTPGTTGGWSVSSQTALTNTKVSVKTSAGTFGGYMIYNPNTTVAYIQVFDVASGSVTLGSTTPTYVLAIPAGSGANLELTCGVNHATAIVIAATTTATGSTAPTTALTAAIFYK